ncbi:hypothetical protein BURMUCF2_A0522 [Burkholderia multivorans CF2]|nr:hypothetical protein BURMUCF2_A0522 [Burkholderia multivorans CF2]
MAGREGACRTASDERRRPDIGADADAAGIAAATAGRLASPPPAVRVGCLSDCKRSSGERLRDALTREPEEIDAETSRCRAGARESIGRHRRRRRRAAPSGPDERTSRICVPSCVRREARRSRPTRIAKAVSPRG